MVTRIRAEGQAGGAKAYLKAWIPKQQGGQLKLSFQKLLPAQPW